MSFHLNALLLRTLRGRRIFPANVILEHGSFLLKLVRDNFTGEASGHQFISGEMINYPENEPREMKNER